MGLAAKEEVIQMTNYKYFIKNPSFPIPVLTERRNITNRQNELLLLFKKSKNRV
jgi:hypothetical protein